MLWFQRASDVEHKPDSQKELPQHGSQLRDQVELHDLTQQWVVTGGVGLELKTHTHTFYFSIQKSMTYIITMGLRAALTLSSLIFSTLVRKRSSRLVQASR